MTTNVVYNFCPARCNVCIELRNHGPAKPGSVVNLQQCSSCKLILYCVVPNTPTPNTAIQTHQRHDWKSHKAFCKAVRYILEHSKINHLLDINGPIRGASKAQYRKARTIAQALLLIQLQRELYQHEKEMIWFPNVCYVCYEYDRKSLDTCQRCNSISYCKNAKHKDSTGHSEIVCEQLRIYYNLLVGKKKECTN